MRVIWLGVGLSAAMGWAAGCGGNVVVDQAAGGGGGSASSSTGGPSSGSASGPSTGQTGPTTGTTGTGGSGQLCASVCEHIGDLGCDDPNSCLAGCLDLYASAPNCAPLLDAYIVCLLENLTDCSDPAACQQQLAAWEQCAMGGGCDGEVDCWVSPEGSCGCKGLCSGQEVGVECAPDPSGLFACQCILNGQLIATCQEPNPTCSFESGCCAPYFP